MDDKKRKVVKTIGGLAVIFVLLSIALVASATNGPCDHRITVTDVCCVDEGGEWGSFYYNITTGWKYEQHYPALFVLHDNLSGEDYLGYCTDYEVLLNKNDTFNASIYRALPTCKNNSIAYILNNWTHSCADCPNVTGAQPAIWYFWYINDTFCEGGTPAYNNTSVPPTESRFIPDCSDNPLACTMINDSINKSVPYAITTTPSSGSFPKGTPIVLTATVSYCPGEGREEVTVVFKTDNGNFSENNSKVYETGTINGVATATLVCEPSVDSAHVTVQVKDMKWFEIVEPCEPYQATLRIINITDDAAFSFYTEKVPVLTPFGIAALIGLLSVVVALSISKGMRRKRE